MSTTSSTELWNRLNSRIVLILAVVMVVLFAFFVWNIYKIFNDVSDDAEYLKVMNDMRVLSQKISTDSRDAQKGKSSAFDEIKRLRDEINDLYTRLDKGTETLPPLTRFLAKDVRDLGNAWQRIAGDVENINANRDRVLFLHEIANTLSASIPELQQKYDVVVDILIEKRGSLEQVANAQKQTWRAERISRNVDKMLSGDGDAAAQFHIDANEFGEVLSGMLHGNSALGIERVNNNDAHRELEEISKLFEFITVSGDDVFKASPDLKKVSDAVGKIAIDSLALMNKTSKLAAKVNGLGRERTFTLTTAIVSMVWIILLGMLMGWVTYSNTKARLAKTDGKNSRNQKAIQRLLDELADLADGDLTTTATVSEDFTGAIADSINFTIEQLRILVSQINDTVLRVSKAAEETQSTALHLTEESEHQAQEIAGVSAAVNEMAVTIDRVSTNASESAMVAEKSVRIASRGAEVVQHTINEMDMIREQIQDTAKRIKRLGESSQEIGDIVSLINDIADQTNILALNAAIQASMAGDAGRGFAVVADEVQRLAERSSAATRQIEALVKTIQSDTNEAVISMEQTTTEVVRGARLAQDAGMALEEIEKVSAELADLIQNISNAARQQAASAGHISNTMNVIQEITQQTNAGTIASARSIGNLADMATELRSSVAGFTLPEDIDIKGM